MKEKLTINSVILDCIDAGKTADETVDEVRRRIATGKISARRIRQIFEEMKDAMMRHP